MIYSSDPSHGVREAFALFEREMKGKIHIYAHMNDALWLPGTRILNDTDPEDALKDVCQRRYGLTPKTMKKYLETPRFWDDQVCEAISRIFYIVPEFEGDFPPDAEFVDSDDVYGMIDKMKMEPRKIKESKN